MPELPSITIIGTGAVGSSLAIALHDAGYRLMSLINKSTDKAQDLLERLGAQIPISHTISDVQVGDVVFVCLPDDTLGNYSKEIQKVPNLAGKTVFHTSGVHAAVDVFSDLAEAGTEIGSTHPLQTFTKDTLATFKDVWVSLNGSDKAISLGRELFTNLGSKTFEIGNQEKVRFHTAAVMVCNYYVALVKAAEDLAGISNPSLKELMMPLMRQTLTNISEKELSNALTGPVARGDLGTIKKHLAAMPDEKSRDLYLILGHYAATLTNHDDVKSFF